MAGEQDKDFANIFGSLSKNNKGLLISMAHFSTGTGAGLDAISATSGLSKEELDKALADLSTQGLVRRGRLEGERDMRFVDDGQGSRYALDKNVKADIFEKVLQMSVDKDDLLF